MTQSIPSLQIEKLYRRAQNRCDIRVCNFLLRQFGLIKALSRRSFNCYFNTFNSAGAILNCGIEIERVSRMMSMPMSISLLGGTPGRSFGKTSGNFFTNETEID